MKTIDKLTCHGFNSHFFPHETMRVFSHFSLSHHFTAKSLDQSECFIITIRVVYELLMLCLQHSLPSSFSSAVHSAIEEERGEKEGEKPLLPSSPPHYFLSLSLFLFREHKREKSEARWSFLVSFLKVGFSFDAYSSSYSCHSVMQNCGTS